MLQEGWVMIVILVSSRGFRRSCNNEKAEPVVLQTDYTNS